MLHVTANFYFYRNLALIPCIAATLLCLSVTLCREWVKRDLHRRLSQPIHVRWRFFYSTRLDCHFKVIYKDFQGRLHRASCFTSWLWPNVQWIEDELVI